MLFESVVRNSREKYFKKPPTPKEPHPHKAIDFPVPGWTTTLAFGLIDLSTRAQFN